MSLLALRPVLLPLTPASTYTPGALAKSRGWRDPALGVMPLEALPVACELTPAWSLPLIQQIVSVSYTHLTLPTN